MKGFFKNMNGKRWIALAGGSLGLFVLYMHLYTIVFGWELPRTKSLRRENERLRTEARLLLRNMDIVEERLDAFEMRDEDVYRPVFAMNSIPEYVRGAVAGGKNRYAELDYAVRNGDMGELLRRSDTLMKRAYVQTKSYDEIELMLKNAGNMATSVPAIPPVAPDPSFYVSSQFGFRLHPVLGDTKLHTGIDMPMKPGRSVYATGDGRIEEIRVEMRGYGRQVIINHGFGYKTRYAHLKDIFVTEGMNVKRGEKIATSGNTGLTSGPHLHYEVIYKGEYVNPLHYFDKDMSLLQYGEMIEDAPENGEFYIHPSHLKKKVAKKDVRTGLGKK